MTVQLNPQSARVAADLNLNSQVAGPSANQAFNAANSSLVSMSPQEGIGDFFQGVWDFVTYPFSAVWNLFFGSSTASKTANAKPGKSDEIPEEFTALFDRKKTPKKFKADDFRAAFEALPEEEQSAFKNMLWVAGGHQAPSKKDKDKGSWASALIAKDKFDHEARKHLKAAFEMMKSRETLKEMSERLSEEGLAKEDIGYIKADFYDKLPAVVKTQVDKLGHAIWRHEAGSSKFKADKEMARPYALACKLLAEGSFVILSKENRKELAAMRKNLDDISTGTTGNMIPFASVTSTFNSLSEKPKALLAEAVGAFIRGSAKDGANYLANSHYHKKSGVPLAVNSAHVRGIVHALSVFNTKT